MRKDGADIRSRSGAFSATLLGGLVLLPAWWLPAAAAADGQLPAGAGVRSLRARHDRQRWQRLTVHGVGFRAGTRVLVSVGGRRTGRAVADSAGSFAASWRLPAVPPGTILTATQAGCTTAGPVSVEGWQAGPPTRPEPPVPPPAVSTAAIPAARLTGLPARLFLGLAGAVLLAGAALTGLTGRLGHRSEHRPSTPVSTSPVSTLPVTPDGA